MRLSLLAATILSSAMAWPAMAQENVGPYNAHFLSGGIGIERDLGDAAALTAADASYTLSAWVRPDLKQPGTVTLIALGNPGGSCRCLALVDGRLALIDGGRVIASGGSVTANRWSHVAAVADGETLRLYVDGREVTASRVRTQAVDARIAIAPVVEGAPHFGGALVGAKVSPGALAASDLTALANAPPKFDLVQIWNVGVGWEWQNRANTGLWRQQDPWTLPMAKVAPQAPVAKPVPSLPALAATGPGHWQINGWTLAAAPDVTAGGAALSRPGTPKGQWYAATVPGTVLTTLVDRGVYPDPYYGLNNLAIPETLSRQDYWYRTSFTVPPEAAGKQLSLMFGGINYASEIWLNGVRIGDTKGAFIRGQFDITAVAGENVIAVQVRPASHPGIPHEQSIRGGVGENGGQLAIDGPTFVATEGWDWIPGIRDRNTGIWRPVELIATGDLKIGDPQIITDLPLPNTNSADIHINVPVTNQSAQSASTTVTASFDGITVSKSVDVAAGETATVAFSPRTDSALRVANPKLWWPNGYGDPALHDMTISVGDAAAPSDTKQVRFGIREVSYDLSLFDDAGALRRVNVQTTNGKLDGARLIDVTHAGIKQSPRGWAESLTAAGEASKGVTDVEATMPEPHLTIRVNGVQIAARGGNWGMDDAMKRVSRAYLAPYFRLQKEAHMNVIRNWMGNNDEDEFFELADENGMMILNDFWQSTQNFQVEPQDPALFLANARDTVARYRNHPSIILWFGRNEGVPYPELNEGLDDVIFAEDGTRWFTGSSNTVNLQGSGPYNYRPPEGYFTDLATGFSVETGTPSLSSAESIRAWVPESELWPLSDTLAYHDWHFAGNGDTKTFMVALATMFGEGTGFDDFERKAQMMNLETHKAMYEGFLGHLWTKNSGRLLWMTHPAWPSNAWQIYSWDYDTQASYYGSKKATEPVHIQLNLPGNELVILNTTQADIRGMTAETRVVGLDNAELFKRTDKVSAPANQATPLDAVPLDTLFAANPMLLVSLTLKDAAGKPVSTNFYWRGKDQAAYQALNTLAPVTLTTTATSPVVDGSDQMIRFTLANPGATPALAAKLTLVDGAGKRILPAYYSDNYVSLLPGEARVIEVRYPSTLTIEGMPSFTLRGWNVTAAKVQ